jgi:pimeloyl-ACP methyl ester carboxylesterase
MGSTPAARFLRGGAAVLGVAGVGALVQAWATRRDRRRYPPPGVLVDVGGHRLHLDVRGDGPGPTVVLEAGMGSFSPNWYWVQSELAQGLRVVAYDRAGLGWSERGTASRDADTLAVELHTALLAAGVPGPYVLAGHSFGGLPVRAFAQRYPGETAGLVLVDASNPDQWVRWPVRNADRMIRASQRTTAVLARVGLLRLVDLSKGISAGLPDRQVAELRARSALPGASAVEAEQMAAWPTSRAQLVSDLGALPLVVLGVTEQPRGAETLTALQAELPGLSTRSVRRVVQGATHESLVARREHALAVVAAIRAVVADGLESLPDPILPVGTVRPGGPAAAE